MVRYGSDVGDGNEKTRQKASSLLLKWLASYK